MLPISLNCITLSKLFAKHLKKIIAHIYFDVIISNIYSISLHSSDFKLDPQLSVKMGGKDHSSKDLCSNVKFESGKGNSKQTSEHDVLETDRGSVGWSNLVCF